MDVKRLEIMPGVFLTALNTDKFKTGCMSVTLLTQLSAKTASQNAVIPYVLRRGTTSCPDMQAVSARLDELYGAAAEPVVRRVGEIQCIGFYASFPDARYLPDGAESTRGVINLLAELLLNPNTRGGLFLPEYVDGEREKLIELIRSRINDKHGWALQRCIENMCCYEDFAVSRFGDEEAALAIRYGRLTKYYRELLMKSPVEIFYCGSMEASTAAGLLRDAFAALPRGEIDLDIGTDIRMNAVEDEPRETVEELDVSQAKLVMGFRLGECMDEPDIAAIRVFNAVYGGGVTSKLFTNVRERLQLCYYASSFLEMHKGLLFVSSGIDVSDYATARDEILAQLEAIRRGEISDEELNAAKAGLSSDFRAMEDSAGELEGFYLSNALTGLEMRPSELAALCEEVSAKDVSRIAESVVLDEIYLLRGEETTEDTADGD